MQGLLSSYQHETNIGLVSVPAFVLLAFFRFSMAPCRKHHLHQSMLFQHVPPWLAVDFGYGQRVSRCFWSFRYVLGVLDMGFSVQVVLSASASGACSWSPWEEAYRVLFLLKIMLQQVFSSMWYGGFIGSTRFGLKKLTLR